MFSALSASTAKEYIRKQRDKIIPTKGVATALAMAPFLRKALPLGKAIDADIQEAAYHDPEEKKPYPYYYIHFIKGDHRGNASVYSSEVK